MPHGRIPMTTGHFPTRTSDCRATQRPKHGPATAQTIRRRHLGSTPAPGAGCPTSVRPPPPPDHPPTEVSRRIPPQDIVRRAIRQPQHDPTPAAAPSRPGHTSQPPPETAARAPRQIKTQKKERIIRSVLCKWYHQESNRGHKDFQSFALPTELWHQPNDNPFRF